MLGRQAREAALWCDRGVLERDLVLGCLSLHTTDRPEQAVMDQLQYTFYMQLEEQTQYND
jgi:hypothetical protein